MKLTDILTEDRVKIPLSHTNKEEIIEEMIGVIDDSVKLENKPAILKAVLDREAVMSTGVGDEVAIPHGKSESLKEIVAALGVAKEPIEFNALDNKPVRVVWLLVGPHDKTGPHLKALSRISRLMHKKEFRDRLIHASAAKEAIDVILSEEEKFLQSV
ncbi:MAG: PTS sugar transporter subunit IIA [bacterium]